MWTGTTNMDYFFPLDRIEKDMLEILSVEPGSIAEELELEAGDMLLAINGVPLRDLVDYHVLAGAEELELEVGKKNGETWVLEFEKDPQEDLGLHLPHP